MWVPKKWQLSFSHIDDLCYQLACAAEVYQPEIVVSVDNGGRYVGARIALALGLPHRSILVRRNIYDIPVLDRLPRFIELLARIILFNFSEPVVIRGLKEYDLSLLRDKRVLLVDDSIASGKTLHIAEKYLFPYSASTRTAVITNLYNHHVDYQLLKGRWSFPWSRTSPEYKKFLSYLSSGSLSGRS